MHRLFRILIKSLTVLSLLLCVATCVLWIRSRYTTDLLEWRLADGTGGRSPVLERGWSYRGGLDAIGIGRQSNQIILPHALDSETARRSIDAAAGFHWQHGPPASLQRWLYIQTRFGFGLSSHSASVGNVEYRTLYQTSWLLIPYWSVIAMSALSPGIWVIKGFRRRSRKSLIACPTCGYDLRATPDRCPECGALGSPGSSLAPGSPEGQPRQSVKNS